MAVGGDYQADECGGRRLQAALLDEVRVDNGVKVMVVDRVVDMSILIIVTPSTYRSSLVSQG